jgi:hypothetical protein
MNEHLAADGALVIFPQARLPPRPKGVKDGPWQAGFIKLAQRSRTPLVPIHLGGRNSLWFYLASWLNKPASALLLVRQLFRQQGQTLPVTIGRIPRQFSGAAGQDGGPAGAWPPLPNRSGQGGTVADRGPHRPAGDRRLAARPSTGASCSARTRTPASCSIAATSRAITR